MFSGKTAADVTSMLTCYSSDDVEQGNATFDGLDEEVWDLTDKYPKLK